MIDFPPDDYTLEIKTWLRNEIYPGLLGETYDDRADAVWCSGSNGFIGMWVSGVGNTLPPPERLQYLKEQLYQKIYNVKHPPSHSGPLSGRLTTPDSGQYYSDNSGPVIPCFIHAGDLIGQGLTFGLHHVEPYMQLFSQAGYHGLRSWMNCEAESDNPFWSTKPAKNWNIIRNKPLAKEIFKLGPKYGLKWHVAAAGLDNLHDGQENEMFDFLTECMREIGSEHFSLIEACNEVRDTGDPDDVNPDELERLINRVREDFPSNLYALSAYTGTEDRNIISSYTPDWMTFYYLHGYRQDHIWDKIRHIYSMGGEEPVVRKLGWQGEPFGPGHYVSVTDNKHELTSGNMAAAGCMSAIARQVWTFMSGPGVILGSEPFDSMAGFRETPLVMRQLPKDLMRFQTLGHSGDRFRGTRIHAAHNNTRADFAIANDGRYVEIIYGPQNELNLPKERQTRDDTVLVRSENTIVTSGRLA